MYKNNWIKHQCLFTSNISDLIAVSLLYTIGKVQNPKIQVVIQIMIQIRHANFQFIELYRSV